MYPVCLPSSQYQGFFPLLILFSRFQRSRNNIEPSCHHRVVLDTGVSRYDCTIVTWNRKVFLQLSPQVTFFLVIRARATWINHLYTRAFTRNLINFISHFQTTLGQALSTSYSYYCHLHRYLRVAPFAPFCSICFMPSIMY